MRQKSCFDHRDLDLLFGTCNSAHKFIFQKGKIVASKKLEVESNNISVIYEFIYAQKAAVLQENAYSVSCTF